MLAISVSAMGTAYAIFVRNESRLWIAFPLAAVIIFAVRPRLAARVVPVALIGLGLFGFVVARDYFIGGGVTS